MIKGFVPMQVDVLIVEGGGSRKSPNKNVNRYNDRALVKQQSDERIQDAEPLSIYQC